MAQSLRALSPFAMESLNCNIPKHHIKQEVCTTRPSYREGRKLTSIKVYTVDQESQYLLVQNVPALGAKDQLTMLMTQYGTIESLHPLDDYPADKFTEVYLVKFKKIQSARFAKKKLDDYSFFGASLHICYAPEYETVQETREKLQDRQKVIASKVRKLEQEAESSSSVQPATQPSAMSSSSQQSLMPKQVPTLPPPPPSSSSFQPPPPPPLPSPLHPSPPQMLLQSVTTPSSAAATDFHQVPGDHRHSEIPGKAPAAQRVGLVPPGCPVDQHMHPDSTTDPTATCGFTLSIPPPLLPNTRNYRTPHFTRRDYGFAWVPSANASFPPGYDPRLPQQTAEHGAQNQLGAACDDGLGKEGVTRSSDRTGGLNRLQTSQTSQLTVNRTGADNRLQLAKSVQGVSPHQPSSQDRPTDSTQKSLAGAAAGQVVVRQYKPKGPPPRFVPRQIKGQAKADDTNTSSKRGLAKTVEEEKNREIRREAFRLGEDQGPSLPQDPEERKQLLGQRPLVDPRVEASVVSSVKAIRKRMAQFISETVSKKMKTSAKLPSAKTGNADNSSAE